MAKRVRGDEEAPRFTCEGRRFHWWLWPFHRHCQNPSCKLVRGHSVRAVRADGSFLPFAQVKHTGGSFKGVRREK